MVSENKIYAHPASVDSIPSSANQEDIVSMGTTAARKAKMILQNTQDVLADELMTACQAIDIRRRLNTHGQGMTPLHEALYQHVREKVAFYEIDREIWPDIRAVEAMIRSGELLDLGIEAKIVEQSGSWFAFGSEKLGQGREKVRALLDENLDLRNQIEAKVIEFLGMHPKEFTPNAEDLDEGAALLDSPATPEYE